MSNYFCGWYFKCQNEKHTIALIPACHQTKGMKYYSLQLVTNEKAWYLPYMEGQVSQNGLSGFTVVGKNIFCRQGIMLNIKMPELTVSGLLRFGRLTPIRTDIMGPFRFVPRMQCRHSVISMAHTVSGSVQINGTDYRFENALGYIEGDRGYSFPSKYAWTHTFFKGGSLMMSAAEIPIGAFRFTGVISVIRWQGKEYRLATYNGAYLEKIQGGEIIVRQGRLRLTAKRLEESAHGLMAPVAGAMKRTIRENPSCRAYYCLQKDGKTLFSFETPHASFEYEY